jgi:autotransporter-associated beta strand protein
MIINSGWFSAADGGGTATLLLKDNASFSDAGDFNVTDNGAATATVVVQDHAQLTANNFYVGKDNNATAVLTISNNATVVSFNGLTMAQHWTGDPVIPTEAVVNLAGGSLAVNLVQGRTTSGTNYGTVNFNGGRLIARLPFAANFMFNLAAINVQAGGALIDSDTNTISIAEPLLDAGGGGGLTKLGLGALFLNGTNTCTGPTLISAGALGGSGSLVGPVTVASGGHLAAASGAIGTFTINNSLTFQSGSGAFLKLASTSSDQIAGLTSVAYAGSLVVSNSGGSPLTVGSVYKLFNSATAGTGNFSSVTLLPGGSATFNPATGELTITAVPVFSFHPPVVSGTNLVLTGSGGAPGGSYTLLTATNVAAPLASWTTNLTGVLNGSGGFSNAIPVSTSERARFFRVRMP